MSSIRYTTTGSMGVINFTRYSTDDIIALLDVIESNVPAPARHNGKVPAEGRYAGTVGPNEIPVLIFKHFTGAPKQHTSYQNGRAVRGHRLLLAHTRWKFPCEVRMLPPEKVYENPMEALAAVVDGEQRLPHQMRDELGHRLLECYAHWSYRYGQTKQENPNFSGLDIRIMQKPAADAPKRSRRVLSIENAMKAYADVEWRAGSAKTALEGLERTFDRMEAAAKKAKIPCEIRDEMNACFQALEAARRAADKFIHQVRQEV